MLVTVLPALFSVEVIVTGWALSVIVTFAYISGCIGQEVGRDEPGLALAVAVTVVVVKEPLTGPTGVDPIVEQLLMVDTLVLYFVSYTVVAPPFLVDTFVEVKLIVE